MFNDSFVAKQNNFPRHRRALYSMAFNIGCTRKITYRTLLKHRDAQTSIGTIKL